MAAAGEARRRLMESAPMSERLLLRFDRNELAGAFAARKPQFFPALPVGLPAAGMRSYGFCVALMAGTVMHYVMSALPGLGGQDQAQPKPKGDDHA